MRLYFFALLLLVACSGVRCPQGYVAEEVDGENACIGAASYCTRDEQCTSARYDCASPCVPKSVNSLFAIVAHEAESRCNVTGIRCRQVPYVEHSCVKNQCAAVAHTAEELIPQPDYREVVAGKVACYERHGFDSILRLNVSNNASLPLQQLEAYVNISLRNGSMFVARVDLLNKTLLPSESVAISQRIANATPQDISIFAVRPIQGRGAAFGVRNEDVVASAEVLPCEGNAFKE